MARISSARIGGALLAVAGAIAIAAVVAAVVFLVPTRTVHGQVVDGLTGQPLPGAVIRMDGRESQSAGDGSFTLGGVRFGTSMDVAAKGYSGSSAIVWLDEKLRLSLNPRIVEGVISDAATLKPLQGAQLSAGTLAATTDEKGHYRLVGIEPGTSIGVAQAEYSPTSILYTAQPSVSVALQPTALDLMVLNSHTGQPLPGAEVSDGRTAAQADQHGMARIQYLRDGAEVTVRFDGFAPAKMLFSGQQNADVRLRPDTVTGTVKDSAGKPIPNAAVSDGKSTSVTDSAGAFRLSGVPENARLVVSASSYERKQMDVGNNSNFEVILKPFAAKGSYLTYYGVGDDGLLARMKTLAETTEINAVVIDIKGDFGWLAYKSNVPMVKEIGAQQEIMIPNVKQLLADLKKRGVYTIARIVTFKDKPLATARPDLAVINSGTGRPWVDGEGLYWTDATKEEVWDYNIALAVEAIQNGFDEVQFDYVRFPTDASAGNPLDSIHFSKANNETNRMASINGFLEKATKAIHAAGGAVSADVFGYVVWRDDDLGIGQKLEEIARRVDYISPMIYPNLFWDGIEVDGAIKYGGQKSGLYPYEIVSESLKVAARRVGAAKLRPWLQYYNDYITDKTYGDAEVKLQKKAAYDNGVSTWLFWDPSNRYVKGGFEPK